VQPDGSLATTPHPALLGSALTHPHITTDFSESQVELITGVHSNADGCLQELTEIHQVVYRAIGDELLWAASMPCRLPADDMIPLGRFGKSMEIAEAVLWLSSDKSSFMTGHYITLDGGMLAGPNPNA